MLGSSGTVPVPVRLHTQSRAIEQQMASKWSKELASEVMPLVLPSSGGPIAVR